jgi:group I intron endonuclease
MRSNSPWLTDADKCGVYAFQHVNGVDAYVGASVKLWRRFSCHIRELNRGVHPSPKFQTLWSPTSFGFTVLEYCNEKELDQREIYWIKKIGTLNRLPGGRYNIVAVNADPIVRQQRSVRAKHQHATGSLHSYFNSATGRAAQKLSRGNRRSS